MTLYCIFYCIPDILSSLISPNLCRFPIKYDDTQNHLFTNLVTFQVLNFTSYGISSVLCLGAGIPEQSTADIYQCVVQQKSVFITNTVVISVGIKSYDWILIGYVQVT